MESVLGARREPVGAQAAPRGFGGSGKGTAQPLREGLAGPCRPPVIPHLEAEVLTDRHHQQEAVQTRAPLPGRRRSPASRAHSSFRESPVPSAAIPPNGDIPGACSLGGVANTPACLSPEGACPSTRSV